MANTPAVQENNNLAIFAQPTGVVPSYAMDDGQMGNENVNIADLTMPQIKVMQPLSPEMETIPGAKTGVLFNDVSNEMFDKVYAINLSFTKQYAIFKQRSKGGGFFGSFDTEAAANAHVATLDGQAVDYQVIETAMHQLLLLDSHGVPTTPAKIYFKSTSLNASRNWNSMLITEAKGGPRFSTVWELSTEKNSNSKGTWWTPKAKFAGCATEELYEAAKAQFLANSSEPA